MELEAEILQIEQLQVCLLTATVARLISRSRYASVWFHTRILARQKHIFTVESSNIS